jgi:hypothetical protein
LAIWGVASEEDGGSKLKVRSCKAGEETIGVGESPDGESGAVGEEEMLVNNN